MRLAAAATIVALGATGGAVGANRGHDALTTSAAEKNVPREVCRDEGLGAKAVEGALKIPKACRAVRNLFYRSRPLIEEHVPFSTEGTTTRPTGEWRYDIPSEATWNQTIIIPKDEVESDKSTASWVTAGGAVGGGTLVLGVMAGSSLRRRKDESSRKKEAKKASEGQAPPDPAQRVVEEHHRVVVREEQQP